MNNTPGRSGNRYSNQRQKTTVMKKLARFQSQVSLPTAGEGIAMASDLVKLLAPVLKTANQSQVDRLKSMSGTVQSVFRILLEGPLLICDEKFAKIPWKNESDVKFRPGVNFWVSLYPEESERRPKTLNVVELYGFKKGEDAEWSHEFESLVESHSIENTRYLVAPQKLTGALDLLEPWNMIQSHMFAQNARLTFSTHDDEFVRVFLQSGTYVEEERVLISDLNPILARA